jgi:glycosyltransferase involved in cell wall biosynthesis
VYTHTLASLQQAKGHEVAVITPHIECYKPEGIEPHYLYGGINVYQFIETADPANRDIYSGKKKPEGLGNFLNLLKQLQPDVVHFHELNRSIGLTIEHVKIARQYGAKIFITMHLSFYTCYTNTLITHNHLCDGKIRELECSTCSYNSMFNMPSIVANPLASASLLFDRTGITALLGKGKITTLLSMPAFINRIKNELAELGENVNQIISLTDWYKKILLLNEVPEKKISVIRQAIASTSYQVTYSNKRKMDLPVRLVFLGRIQPQKGVHLIIEAFQSFTEQEVLIDIYGKEETSDYYKKCVADVENMPNVFLKGMMERAAVVETLAGYDMLCLPSVFSEMSPLVIQEAFAAGIPVLASKVYGNMEQIKHGVNGLLFNFNSADSMKEQLRLVVDNSSLINDLKQSILPPANFETVNESYLRLYETC